MVNSILQILLGPLLGWFLDLTGNAYRYTFVIGALIALAALGAGLVLLTSLSADDPAADSPPAV